MVPYVGPRGNGLFAAAATAGMPAGLRTWLARRPARGLPEDGVPRGRPAGGACAMATVMATYLIAEGWSSRAAAVANTDAQRTMPDDAATLLRCW